MKPKELRELDAWIAENVMGKKAISRDGQRPTKGTEDDYFVREWIHISGSLPRYTTDPASAMLVLEKCAEKRTAEGYDVYRPDATLCVSAPHPDWENKWVIMSDASGTSVAEAGTFPLAICLFAKQLFSK